MSNSTRFTPSREIFERALSHYLQPASPKSLTVHHDLSFEDALAQLCDLLRCVQPKKLLTHHKPTVGAGLPAKAVCQCRIND